MGLLESAVALANGLTKSLGLQASVTHEAYTGQNGAGTRTFAGAVARDAIVTLKQRLIRQADGSMVQARAQIVLLDSTLSINILDRFTLPDGTTGPILDLEGFVHQGANRPLLTQVWLG